MAQQIELEQYPTGPHIASRLLYTVNILRVSVSLISLYLYQMPNLLHILFVAGWIFCIG